MYLFGHNSTLFFDETTLNFGLELNNIYRAIMGKIWTKIGHNKAEFAVFFWCFSMELSVKKNKKTLQFHLLLQRALQRSAPFISWETCDWSSSRNSRSTSVSSLSASRSCWCWGSCRPEKLEAASWSPRPEYASIIWTEFYMRNCHLLRRMHQGWVTRTRLLLLPRHLRKLRARGTCLRGWPPSSRMSDLSQGLRDVLTRLSQCGGCRSAGCC